jgi:metal iron transporter
VSFVDNQGVFIEQFSQPFLTRSVTRMLALIPATIVAAAVGRDGINALLVASQVILSLILPFVVFPLVWLTSNEAIMTVENTDSKEGGTVSFKNSLVLQILGYTVFALVVVANIAALVTLAIGD